MLIGCGCTVPAVMATRTLSSERDRNMTIMLTPFMSCSAKIPIYTVFAAAFFPGKEALVMILLYAAGIIVGIISALVLNHTAFRGNPIPFVMELPNYRFPSAKSVFQLMWDKAKDFIQRAFTVIFVATIIIWFLQTFDTRLNVVADSSNSLLALVGRWIAPVFAPLGFSDWRVSTALITGFTAKEAVNTDGKQVCALQSGNRIEAGKFENTVLYVEKESILNVNAHFCFPVEGLAQGAANLYLNGELMATVQTGGTGERFLTQRMCRVKFMPGYYELKAEYVTPELKLDWIELE